MHIVASTFCPFSFYPLSFYLLLLPSLALSHAFYTHPPSALFILLLSFVVPSAPPPLYRMPYRIPSKDPPLPFLVPLSFVLSPAPSLPLFLPPSLVLSFGYLFCVLQVQLVSGAS
ncbi:unnamed protein product, partial [Laminaria digitata]